MFICHHVSSAFDHDFAILDGPIDAAKKAAEKIVYDLGWKIEGARWRYGDVDWSLWQSEDSDVPLCTLYKRDVPDGLYCCGERLIPVTIGLPMQGKIEFDFKCRKCGKEATVKY